MLMLGMPAAWIVGQQSGLDASTLMAVFWLSPLFILLLARLFLREGVPASIWVVTAVACVGSFVIHEPGSLSRLALLAFPLGMALCFSLYVVMTRSLRSEATRANLFYTALGVFVALLPFLPTIWVTPTPHDLLAMVGVGVLGFAGLCALDRMAAAAPVSVSAPFAYLQIVATAGVALVAGMGHDMSLRRMGLGLLLIAGAALYLWVREPRLKVRDALAAQPNS
jgi:drug/metabolite transporter (DMT)-like permease